MSRLLLSAALMALPLSVWAETPNLEPGEWEFTSTATVEGDFPIPEQSGTQTECLSQEEIEDAHSGNLGQEQGCELIERQGSAEGMTYVMVCPSEEGEVTINGDMQYMQDRYEGNMRVETATAMGDMVMNTFIEGRRLGDC